MRERMRRMSRWGLMLTTIGGLAFVGCAPRSEPATRDVQDAWRRPSAPEPAASSLSGEFTSRSQANVPSAPADSVGTIDGEAFSRAALVELLLRTHGPVLFNELVVIARADAEAQKRGLTLRDEQIDEEHQRFLRSMVDPLSGLGGEEFNRAEAERVLDVVLAEKGLSREEYRLGLKRTSLLRLLVKGEVAVSDEEVEVEVRRRTGPRVSVRHIQVGSLLQAEQALSELRAGRPFEEVAIRLSGHRASAPEGGLLPPFSREDPRVPATLRAAAFALEPGQVSDPIRVGNWYHLLRVEGNVPPEGTPSESARDTVREELRRIREDERIPGVYQRLLNEANVEIHDPALRSGYHRLDPARRPKWAEE